MNKKMSLLRNRFQLLSIKSLAAVSAVAIGVCQSSMAATRTWDGGSTGTGTSFNTNTNWSNDTLPTTGDDALFSSVTPSSLNINGSRTVGDLIWNINGSVTYSIASAATITSRTSLSGATDNTALLANGGAAGDLFLIGSSVTSGTFIYSGSVNPNSQALLLRVSTAGNFNVVNAGATLDISSVIDSNSSASNKVTKTGAGTLIIRSDNSAGFTSDFDVSAGTLLLAGGNVSNASTQVTVLAGGRFSGNGSVRDLVVQNGGTLAPNSSTGTGVGNLNVLGTLTLNNTSTKFDIASAGSFDTITATGAVGLNGAFELSFGSLLANGTSIDLFAGAGALSGDFASISAVGSYSGSFIDGGTTWTYTNGSQTLTFDSTTGVLSVAAVPEPAAAGLAVFGLTVGFLLRRRAVH